MAEISSAEWLKRLNTKLDGRQDRLALLEDYYAGNHRLSFATSKFRQTFGHLFKALAVNFCLLVVDAERERLNIEGFRVGDDPAAEADADAWKMWQRNRLDARSSMAHAEALSKGSAYVLVWSNPTNPEMPLIRVQDARKCYVEHDDGDLDSRLAGIKRWVDADRYENATLYLPDRIEKYRSRDKVTPGMIGVRNNTGYWRQRAVDGEAWPLPNPLGIVPLIPLLNNPLLDSEGRSELTAVIPIQDAINKLVADMIVASEFVSFPQRWATGIEVPVDELTGQPIEPFRAAVDRLWLADVQTGMDQTIEPKFGQFPAGDLTPYTAAIEMLVQHVASITKTPAHYLLGSSGNFPSGESLKATETGLVAKSRGAMRYLGEGWEEAIRLARMVKGDGDPEETIEVIWRDPESRVMSELTDALGKQVAQLKVPIQVAWEKAGYSQTEIARMEVLNQQAALQAPPVQLQLPTAGATSTPPLSRAPALPPRNNGAA